MGARWTEAPTFQSANGPGRLPILRKLLFWRPIAQRAARTAYKTPVNVFVTELTDIVTELGTCLGTDELKKHH
jgi:hypothetical protein